MGLLKCFPYSQYMLFIRQQDNATVHSAIKQNEAVEKKMKIEIQK